MEIWATLTHPPLRTYTNSSLASCILVQLSDLCNLGFAVHVQYGITNYTCWRHARYWGVCSGASHLPNSLIYKKVPQIAVCEQRSLKNWEFYVFLDKEMAQSSGKGPLCQICTLWGKKNLQNFCKMPTFRKSGRDSLLKNLHPPQAKILGMGLVEASQMHRLRKQGGLRELSSLNILRGGGVGVSFSPPKKSYILKHLD